MIGIDVGRLRHEEGRPRPSLRLNRVGGTACHRTARHPGATSKVGGIQLFRVPLGVLFRGVMKFNELEIGDIEIIEPHHRHVTAWP